jgi:transcriptional regulator GlxA family with amidase domain
LRFNEALGHPISDEIRRLRLTAAQRMLGDPAWQINDIARQTGFGTYVLMNQVFHREVGISPSAYRKQVLGKRDA